MPFASAEIILFGIQAGVRLYGAARQSYIENTRERDITLPLPGMDHKPDVGQAESYFLDNENGKRHLAESDRLIELHAKLTEDRQEFEENHPDEAEEYVKAFVYFRGIDLGKTEEGLSPADILAVTTIAQWKRGETPHPTALKRIAGTLVEIGIDYFTSGPGRITGETPTKAVLSDLLSAMDDHAFSTEGLDRVVEKLFIASLDSIAENPVLVSGDPKARQLVSSVAKGLVKDINNRLKALPEEERIFAVKGLDETAGLILRSILRHGTGHVLANPVVFLDVDGDGESQLITRVGTAVLNTIIPTVEDSIDLSALFTYDSIDRLIRAGLTVVVEYPELLKFNDDGKIGLQRILQEVAAGLLESSQRFGPDLFPEIARLILEKTSNNLHLFWEPDDDKEHLLVTAIHTLLDSLTKKSSDDTKWELAFSKTQILVVIEAVVDEVADNPAMITNKIDGSVPIETAVESVLAELAKLDMKKVSSSTVVHVVKVAVKAAASRMDFLNSFEYAGGKTKTAIAHVIDAIFTTAFSTDIGSERAAWAMAKASTLEAITEAAFAELAREGVDVERLKVLKEALDETAEDLNNNKAFSVDHFVEKLNEKLKQAR